MGGKKGLKLIALITIRAIPLIIVDLLRTNKITSIEEILLLTLNP